MAKKKDHHKLFAMIIVSVLICLMVGFVGSIFTAPNIPTWYASLVKPEFAPPNWVFFPVWTTLYILIGISFALIWQSGFRKKENKIAGAVFAIQLFLNGIWSYLFFGLQNIFYGLIGIIAVWISILATMILFYKISKKATYLLIPYILWVSFATFVNYYLWILNP
jgi:tryptophan-rich sensory protein